MTSRKPMASTEIKHGHTMSVIIDRLSTVELKLVCHDDTQNCHYCCMHQDCESWCADDHVYPDRRNNVEEGHHLEWQAKCNAVEWMEDEGPAEYFVGANDTPLSDGMAVEAKWDGDTYIWKVTSSPLEDKEG